MPSCCHCCGGWQEQRHCRHCHQLPLPLTTPAIAAAIGHQCRNGKDDHRRRRHRPKTLLPPPPLCYCCQRRRQRHHHHHHHQLLLPHNHHWLCLRAAFDNNDSHPHPHCPSPCFPVEEDQTVGRRAGCDASLSLLPWSSLLVPSSSPLTGQWHQGRWRRRQTRPSCRYPRPGRGGTPQPHLPLRMQTAIAGLALRGRRPARCDCRRTSPCSPCCPQFDCCIICISIR